MALVGSRYLEGARDVLSGRRHVYYGWWVLAVGTVAMALGSGLSMSSFGLYVGPLEDEFGWTRAEVSLGFSASVLTGGLSAPLIGHWIDSRGARSSIVLGALLASGSYLLLASTQTLWQFYLFYGIHAVCRQMMFFLPFQALMSQWFVSKRGVALSILGSGFSLGGFAVLPIVAMAIGGLGWRGAYVFSGITIAAFFIPAGLLVLRNRPSDVGEQPDGEAPEQVTSGAPAREPASASGMTLKEAARTPLFWICAFGFMLLFFGMMGWMVHQVPFYESKGMSRSTATLIVSLSAACSIVARLAMGVIADRFERFELVVVILMALLMAAMATLLVSTSPPAIALFLLFWVIGASAGPMVESLVLIKAFGIRHFATILGAMLVVETSGQIISPSLAGAIYDSTGSYDGALVMFMSAFGLGLLLFLFASRLKTSRLREDESLA
ncbi:MAG TPA: MFS transporter [Dehalococcoidia bacterium]|nr:MFS transporter [Dehalococcoidia bacterium]